MNAMSFPKRCKWALPLPNLMADQICVARVLILTLLRFCCLVELFLFSVFSIHFSRILAGWLV